MLREMVGLGKELARSFYDKVSEQLTNSVDYLVVGGLAVAGGAMAVDCMPRHRHVHTSFPAMPPAQQRDIAERGLEITLADNCNLGYKVSGNKIYCEQSGELFADYDEDYRKVGDFHDQILFVCEEIDFINEPGIGSMTVSIYLVNGDVFHFKPRGRDRALDLSEAVHTYCSLQLGHDIERR